MARPRSEDKRSATVSPDAAAQVVAEYGVSAPTAKISKVAGVAEGTLFTYFATKDELLNHPIFGTQVRPSRIDDGRLSGRSESCRSWPACLGLLCPLGVGKPRQTQSPPSIAGFRPCYRQNEKSHGRQVRGNKRHTAAGARTGGVLKRPVPGIHRSHHERHRRDYDGVHFPRASTCPTLHQGRLRRRSGKRSPGDFLSRK